MRHTRCLSDWSSDVCSSDLHAAIRHRVENIHADILKAFDPSTRAAFVRLLLDLAREAEGRIGGGGRRWEAGHAREDSCALGATGARNDAGTYVPRPAPVRRGAGSGGRSPMRCRRGAATRKGALQPPHPEIRASRSTPRSPVSTWRRDTNIFDECAAERDGCGRWRPASALTRGASTWVDRLKRPRPWTWRSSWAWRAA